MAAFPDTRYCPFFQRTMELIGKRWTAAILRCLFAGDHRFSEIQAAIPGLSARLLAVRLRELMEAGLVEVRLGGPDAGYWLTEPGEDLREAFQALESWNVRWVPGKGTVPGL